MTSTRHLNPVEEIMSTMPDGIRPPSGSGAPPAGVEAGHLYAYKGGERMGTAYAQADGSFTLKVRGVTAAFPTANAAALTFTHMTYSCPTCGGK